MLITFNSFLAMFIAVGTISSTNLHRTIISKNYQIEEEYTDIELELDKYDIYFYLSDNNENKIVYKENKKIYLNIEINNGVLRVNEIDNRKFYERFIALYDLDLKVYLSKELINSLNIDFSTGNIVIDSGFIFNNLDIVGSTGNVESSANVLNNMNVETETGNIKISDSKVNGNLDITASTGNIVLNNVKSSTLNINISTGKTKLTNVIVENDFNMEGSTGDVIMDGFDAENIYITLSTGDVTGTILSSKFFFANSDTGDVEVPKTREGGVCEIKVSTGDIKISYK